MEMNILKRKTGPGKIPEKRQIASKLLLEIKST
jgi:hypothetical protein